MFPDMKTEIEEGHQGTKRVAAAFGRGPSEPRKSRKGPGLAQSEHADFMCRDMWRTLPALDAGPR